MLREIFVRNGMYQTHHEILSPLPFGGALGFGLNCFDCDCDSRLSGEVIFYSICHAHKIIFCV